ncbi:hypothetical protein [Ensifer sp. LC163]|uniref:hypothetical protein n=1 Tax=Ensifer sp. LC163 TaxID=1120652 RepID=UPI001AD82010|nr:hypothetical protein [Ensifer sp. LC163]
MRFVDRRRFPFSDPAAVDAAPDLGRIYRNVVNKPFTMKRPSRLPWKKTLLPGEENANPSISGFFSSRFSVRSHRYVEIAAALQSAARFLKLILI